MRKGLAVGGSTSCHNGMARLYTSTLRISSWLQHVDAWAMLLACPPSCTSSCSAHPGSMQHNPCCVCAHAMHACMHVLGFLHPALRAGQRPLLRLSRATMQPCRCTGSGRAREGPDARGLSYVQALQAVPNLHVYSDNGLSLHYTVRALAWTHGSQGAVADGASLHSTQFTAPMRGS